MLKYETVTTEEATCTICDRCGRQMHKDDLNCEWHERVSVAFRAGYDSIFCDGNDVELDLCQHCFKETLGQWIRVTAPFSTVAEGIVQAGQGAPEKLSIEPEQPVAERKGKKNDE